MGLAVKTVGWVSAAILVVAGCTSDVPDSGSGVGFGDYADYELERARREAALTGQPLSALVPQTTVGPTPNADVIPGVEAEGEAEVPEAADQAITSDELAAAGIGGAQAQQGALVPLGEPVGVIAPAPAVNSGGLANATITDPNASLRSVGDNPNISDEQSFDAVTGRETIESDAQRRAQQAERLVVVEPVPLPTTRANSGPNIVQYAINAPNQKGQQWYSRSILSGDNRFQRNCATYANPDAAQRDFLARGGPERDTRGIDPDGDGFACGWDPAPFRLAAGN